MTVVRLTHRTTENLRVIAAPERFLAHEHCKNISESLGIPYFIMLSVHFLTMATAAIGAKTLG
jgi:hypothetical protein